MMRCLGIFLLCLLALSGVFGNEDIHEYMSSEEFERTFHMNTDSAPIYEVVEIYFNERLHKRDLLLTGSKMHIKAFGEDVNLWLHPTESVLAGIETPVYYARDAPLKKEAVDFSRRDGLMGMIGRIYEDPDKMASMVIGTEESGRTRINGFIDSKKLAVRSLPTRVADEYRRRRRSVVGADQTNSTYHVVFKIHNEFHEDYNIPPINPTQFEDAISGFDDGVPDTIYPEVLVVVDYSMHKAYERDIYGLLEYILAFWNGVDLKYRSLESPKVRFHISGIVLANDTYALTYISRNELTSTAFNSTAALRDATKYWYQMKDTFPSDSYDFAVTMTRRRFGVGEAASILGQAWIGSACSFHEFSKTTYGISMIYDNGAFFGVFVAAHEIGHLLGSGHDESENGCPHYHGFVMSFTPWYTANSSDFSTCSTTSIDKKLKLGRLDCLFNRPETTGKVLPKIMPGRLLDLEGQCRAMDLQAPCQTEDHNACKYIRCLDTSGNCLATSISALDGTICQKNPDKFCLHQKCVSL